MVLNDKDEFKSLLRPINFILTIFLLTANKPKRKLVTLLFSVSVILWAFLFISIILIFISKCKFWFDSYKLHGFTIGRIIDLAGTIYVAESIVSFLYVLYWQYSNRIDFISNCILKATGWKGITKHKKILIRYMVTNIVISILYIFFVNFNIVSSIFKFSDFRIDDLNFGKMLFGMSILDPVAAVALMYCVVSWILAILIYISVSVALL